MSKLKVGIAMSLDGFVDEVEVDIVPVLLNGGTRPFAKLDGADVRLEQVRVVETPGVTHVKYAVRREDRRRSVRSRMT